MNTINSLSVSHLIKRLLLVSLLLAPTFSWAISLSDAKEQGLVGELTTGYLGHIHADPSADIKTLINDINTKRKAAYIKKAKDAGVSLQVMEQSVGKRLIERAEKGHYISNGKGSWQKK